MPINKKSKILVIDDDEALLDVLATRLTREGYEVITASNGHDGLDKAHSEKPNLVLLDIIMPVLDGFQFVKKVQEDVTLKKLPIIVMSGRTAMKDTFDVLGIDLFIAKPFESVDLISAIKLLLKKKVLLVSESHRVIDAVTESFKKYDYETHTVMSEKEMYNKGRELKYDIIVVHIPYITKEPKDFVQSLDALKNRQPALLVYCDNEVKNTEDNDTLAIKEISTQWERAGVKNFYDHRIMTRPFSELAGSLVAE
jgi:DNA-binding response OmpR family regulator